MEGKVHRALRPHIGGRIEGDLDLVHTLTKEIIVDDKLQCETAGGHRDEARRRHRRDRGASHFIRDRRDIIDRDGEARQFRNIGTEYVHGGDAGRIIDARVGAQHDPRRGRRAGVARVLNGHLPRQSDGRSGGHFCRRGPRARRVSQLFPAGAREAGRHRVGVDRRGKTVLRRGVAPFKFVVLGFGREIRRVAQRDLLIERIERGDHLHLTRVDLLRDAEGLQTNRLAHRGKSSPVAKDHGHPTTALPRTRDRVIDDRGVGAAHRRRGRCIHRHRQGGIRFIRTLLRGVFDKCFDGGGERVDRAAPSGRLGVVE